MFIGIVRALFAMNSIKKISKQNLPIENTKYYSGITPALTHPEDQPEGTEAWLRGPTDPLYSPGLMFQSSRWGVLFHVLEEGNRFESAMGLI